LADAHEEAEKLAAVRGRVLAVVGHALRTPVTTIRGLVEVLERSGPDAMGRVLPSLTRTSRLMERLVDDLLIASDVVTALPVRAPEPMSARGTVRSVWDDLDDLTHGHELHIEGDTEAMVGPDGLRWMLRHLLENAVKYGDGPVRVVLRDGESDAEQRAVIEVSSGGPQLTAEELVTFTEPFFREESAVMAAHGLGLGLAVTARLAVHAGGELRLSARPGGGLDAILTLPAP
jgi:signal transduction histidine kinase